MFHDFPTASNDRMDLGYPPPVSINLFCPIVAKPFTHSLSRVAPRCPLIIGGGIPVVDVYSSIDV